MTKTPITLQDLRRRLYVKAKAEPSWRFWGLYAHVCKRETLRAAYQAAKQNDGAPGTDGVTFEAIEVDGVERFLDQLREELVQRCYRPQRPRKVGIPKEGGKVRQLSIPLCLLKSPFLLRQLMLRAAVGTLLDHDLGAALALPDLANSGVVARRAPARNPGLAAPVGGAAAHPTAASPAREDGSLALGTARAPLDRMANGAGHR
jgi:hypothetical protein